MQRENGLFTGEDGVGVATQRVPVLLYGIDFRAQRLGHGGQANAVVALRQITPALVEVVTSLFQGSESLLCSRCRFHGVLGDLLGQYAQLSSVSDVLVIVIRLRIHVREVREQQYDRDDQHDKQTGDQRIAAHPAQQSISIHFDHYPAPAWTSVRFHPRTKRPTSVDPTYNSISDV